MSFWYVDQKLCFTYVKSTPAFSKQLLYESNNEHYWTPFFCRIKCIFLRNDLTHTNTVSLSTHLDPFLESKWIKGLISLSVGNQKPLPTVSQNCKFTESYHVHLCSMFAHALTEVGVQQSTRRRLLRHVSLGFWRLRAGRNDTNILLGSDCNVKMSSDHDHGPSSYLSPPQVGFHFLIALRGREQNCIQ